MNADVPTCAKANPIYQCDCTRCAKELFDQTDCQFWALCSDCAYQVWRESPEGQRELAAMSAQLLHDWHLWRNS